LFGTRVADSSVDSNARLLSVRTGIGGTEKEILAVRRPQSYNWGVANLTIDSQGAVNVPGIRLNNQGLGASGIMMYTAGGGFFQIQAGNASFGLYAENRPLQFTQNANAYSQEALMRWNVVWTNQVPATIPAFDFQTGNALQSGQKHMRWMANNIELASLSNDGSFSVAGNVSTGGSYGVRVGSVGVGVTASSFPLVLSSGWGLTDDSSTRALQFKSLTTLIDGAIAGFYNNTIEVLRIHNDGSIVSSRGAVAGSVTVKAGTTLADGSVNSGAKLLSVRTGIGGTESEKFYIRKSGSIVATSNNIVLGDFDDLNGVGSGVKYNQMSTDIGFYNSSNTSVLALNTISGVAYSSGNFVAGGTLRWSNNTSGGLLNQDSGQSRLDAPNNTTMAITSSNGASATDVAVKVGSRVAGGSVNAGAKLFVTSTGIGGTESEKSHIRASGAYVVNNAGGSGNHLTFGNATDLYDIGPGVKYDQSAAIIGLYNANNASYLGLGLGDGVARSTGTFRAGGTLQWSGSSTGGLYNQSGSQSRLDATSGATMAISSSLGSSSSHVAVKVGTTVADTSVHPGAELLSVRTGIGSSETKKAAVMGSGSVYASSGKFIGSDDLESSYASVSSGNVSLVINNGNDFVRITSSDFRYANTEVSRFRVDSSGDVTVTGGVYSTSSLSLNSSASLPDIASTRALKFTSGTALTNGSIAGFYNTTSEKALINANGEYENLVNGKGIYLRSPSGTRYNITVDDNGSVTTGAQIPWNAPTFAANWGNVGSPWMTAGYRKLATGEVMLRGLVRITTSTLTTLIFTLPAGYRPSARLQFPVRMGTNALSYVEIRTDGGVHYAGSGGGVLSDAQVSLTLDGIIFDTQ
jgi:hypothetical protein